MEKFNGTAEGAEKQSTEDAGTRGLLEVKRAVEQNAVGALGASQSRGMGGSMNADPRQLQPGAWPSGWRDTMDGMDRQDGMDKIGGFRLHQEAYTVELVDRRAVEKMSPLVGEEGAGLCGQACLATREERDGA